MSNHDPGYAAAPVRPSLSWVFGRPEASQQATRATAGVCRTVARQRVRLKGWAGRCQGRAPESGQGQAGKGESRSQTDGQRRVRRTASSLSRYRTGLATGRVGRGQTDGTCFQTAAVAGRWSWAEQEMRWGAGCRNSEGQTVASGGRWSAGTGLTRARVRGEQARGEGAHASPRRGAGRQGGAGSSSP